MNSNQALAIIQNAADDPKIRAMSTIARLDLWQRVADWADEQTAAARMELRGD
jgi:hypothetical protein